MLYNFNVAESLSIIDSATKLDFKIATFLSSPAGRKVIEARMGPVPKDYGVGDIDYGFEDIQNSTRVVFYDMYDHDEDINDEDRWIGKGHVLLSDVFVGMELEDIRTNHQNEKISSSEESMIRSNRAASFRFLSMIATGEGSDRYEVNKELSNLNSEFYGEPQGTAQA